MYVDSEAKKKHLSTKVQDVKSLDPNVEQDQPMPIKVKPYSHQIIGYNLACRILGIFEGGG